MSLPGVERHDARIFARADMPARHALTWLRAVLNAQPPGRGLGDQESEQIRALLHSDWWRAAVTGGDGSPKAALRRLLPRAVHAAAADPLGGLVLALYLRNLVNEAWALAWDHEVLSTAVDSAAAAAATRGWDPLTEQAWNLLRFLTHEFRTETALLTGRLDAVAHVGADTVAEITAIVTAIEQCPDAPGRDVLLAEAGNELRYYRAVQQTARAAARLLDGDRSSARDELERMRADAGLSGLSGMDASEVRGHLAGVRAIDRARTRDWLHVDSGRVRIFYPFGVRTTGRRAPEDVVTSIRTALEQQPEARRRIGGFEIESVQDRLELSDVWQGTDILGRAYDGATIELAPLTLSAPLTGHDPVEIRGRIQLSHLGNHVIVFDIELKAASARRLAEVISLATPVFGDLSELPGVIELRAEHGPRLKGLAHVADELLRDLRELLHHGESDADSVAAREGSFGVLTTITAASAVSADGRVRSLADPRALLRLWGAQPLLHPLPSGAAGVADWARYDLDAVSTWPLLHLNNEMLASNSNVTLLVAFDSPEYSVREMESYIEFAHSMHGLYHGWQETVRAYAEQVAELLRRAEDLLAVGADGASRIGEAARAELVADFDGLVRDIEGLELSLQSFVQSNEATMLFIESPALVTSPPLRVDLDTVLESNGYSRLREGFTRAVHDVLGTRLRPLLDVVHRRLEQAHTAELAARQAAADEQRAEQVRRNERMFDVLSVVLAVVGFSGLVAVLQAGHPAWGGGISWWLFAGVLVLTAVTGLVTILLARRRDAAPRSRRRLADRGKES